MKIVRKILLFALFLFIISCSEKPNITKLYPTGNLNLLDTSYKYNSNKDEIAPVARPAVDKNISNPYYREFLMPKSDYKDVKPSSKFARENLGLSYSNELAVDYLTKNIESISFIDNNTGFISFSHPPTPEYARQMGLPFAGLKDIEGGTDIFQFQLFENENQFKFKSLESIGIVNSTFWDSHPFAADTIIDGKKHTVLIWSSDKDAPYSDKITLKGDTIKIGNTDLYYSFRVDNQWSEARKLQQDINTSSNEGSPFLFCLCNNPTLFFSSNRDGVTRDDYDIFKVRVQIDFANKRIIQDEQVSKFVKTDQAKGRRGEDDTLGTINSSYDERFPYVPNPVSDTNDRYIYFSSNRNTSPKYYGKDTVIVANGGYDIYRFPIDASFKCVPPPPPPPPKLYLQVTVNELELSPNKEKSNPKKQIFEYDTIRNDKDIRNANYKLNSDSKKSQQIFEIDLNKEYRISRNIEYACSESDCEVVKIKTPSTLKRNDTIRIPINCVIKKKVESFYDTTITKGIGMFVTGYWWPLTSENYLKFKEKGKNGDLKNSQFIDSTDYKYYDAVTQKNDEWFEQFYIGIENILRKFDDCYNNQKIVITTNGYTDPCRLRQTANDEFTKFSSDGDIVFNDVIVPAGTSMKNPKLQLTTGADYKLAIPSQNGNAMLSLLRSYFTRMTIEDGLKQRLKNKPDLLKKYQNVVKYQMNYYGVFDAETCPKLTKNIIAMDLPNTPANPEACNDPRSRRVMIYVNTVSNSEYEKGLNFNECGELTNKIAKKAKALIVEEQKETKDKEPKLINLQEKTVSEVLYNAPPGMGCPGPCFWIEYAIAKDEADFNLIKAILNSLGVNDVRRDPRYSDKFIVISATNPDKELVMQSAKSFEKVLKERLEGFIDIKTVNVRIMPEN